MPERECVLPPLGFLQSPLTGPGEAPRQGPEGVPDAWLDVWSRLNVATKQGAGQGPPEGGVARVLSEDG